MHTRRSVVVGRRTWVVALGLAAVGVMMVVPARPATAQEVTFARDIAPLFQEKCQACHRSGSMAPMSLVTYEETPPLGALD